MLVVLDGWGIGPESESKYNAIRLAKTPNIERLRQQYGLIELCASGECVGLNAGQMGNSEVGHLTLGAGRVIFQDLLRVTDEISTGRLAQNPILNACFRKLKDTENSLHFLGLVSSGGVHSHIDHLFALIRMAKGAGLRDIRIHVILDGRDTPPKSGADYTASLLSYVENLGVGSIATVSGRYYAMDRDGRWERTKVAYDAIVHGKGKHAEDPIEAIRQSYDEKITDEFVVPQVIDGYSGLKDHDVVLFFNFRPDRARQLTKALAQSEVDFDRKFDRIEELRPRNIDVITMTVYDSDLRGPKALLGRELVPETLSDVLEKNGKRQIRIAETEKFAHVTYFFNGLSEAPKNLEERVLVPSAREVGTYDKKPEMMAREITIEALKAIKARKYAFILVNYANADMVGHSGNLDSTIRAVEAVDMSLGILESALNDSNGDSPSVLITADHGNAEKMFDPSTGQPHTAHTSNAVPLILVSNDWELSVPLDYRPGLVDVAPSILSILGLAEPTVMTGKSLVREKDTEY